MILRPLSVLLSAFFFYLLLSGCGGEVLLPEELSKDTDAREFLALALNQETLSEDRFAAMDFLIIKYKEIDALDELTLLLWHILEISPEDSYKAYYLMALGENARSVGALPVALDYWRRLLNSSAELIIRDQSLHLLAMKEIARETEDPHEAIKLYEKMLRSFSDRIDVGRTHYVLAELHEKVGNWNAAYTAYKTFLQLPETKIPGRPNAYESVRKDLLFHASDKSWTVEDLETLVNTIKRGIRTRNIRLINRYRAQDFFLMNWLQETSDSFTHIPMDLAVFLTSSVGYQRDLEPFSNESEAYLRTWGWSYRIQTWYLYFRKIRYPANPEINGRWEWAGIYFGEPL